MNTEEIKREIMNVIRESTETELTIMENTHLIKDMGLSSIETMILVSDLEEAFDIRIPASKLRNVQTIRDLYQIVADALSET